MVVVSILFAALYAAQDAERVTLYQIDRDVAGLRSLLRADTSLKNSVLFEGLSRCPEVSDSEKWFTTDAALAPARGGGLIYSSVCALTDSAKQRLLVRDEAGVLRWGFSEWPAFESGSYGGYVSSPVAGVSKLLRAQMDSAKKTIGQSAYVVTIHPDAIAKVITKERIEQTLSRVDSIKLPPSAPSWLTRADNLVLRIGAFLSTRFFMDLQTFVIRLDWQEPTKNLIVTIEIMPKPGSPTFAYFSRTARAAKAIGKSPLSKSRSGVWIGLSDKVAVEEVAALFETLLPSDRSQALNDLCKALATVRGWGLDTPAVRFERWSGPDGGVVALILPQQTANVERLLQDHIEAQGVLRASESEGVRVATLAVRRDLHTFLLSQEDWVALACCSPKTLGAVLKRKPNPLEKPAELLTVEGVDLEWLGLLKDLNTKASQLPAARVFVDNEKQLSIRAEMRLREPGQTRSVISTVSTVVTLLQHSF